MKPQQKITYNEVKCRYESLREVSRKAALNQLPQILPNKRGQAVSKNDISFDGFTFKVDRALRAWQRTAVRRVDWDWETVQKKYRPAPKRFELAIWHRDLVLCGAAMGKPTYGGGKLRLDFIEANPEGSPLDGLVTDIIIAAATVYADVIGATQLRITNPINAQVKNHYLDKAGFKYDQRSNFCYKEL